MNKMKLFYVLALFLVGIIALSGVASAAITINKVEVNDDPITESSTSYVQGVEKGDEIEIKVHVTSNESVENVKVDAELSGDVHDDVIGDDTKTFDMKAGVTYVKKLNLKLSKRMEQDTYTLYVDVRGRHSDQDSKTYSLEVDAPKHNVEIRDIILSPENEVKAGRALLASVRIKNRGEEKEEDLKVKISIPELGISASDYVDELDEEDGDDDSTTSEELYLRIPDCAEAGTYTLIASVEYDDGDEEVTGTTSIEIVESNTCQATAAPVQEESKTIITIGPEVQDATVGTSVMYSVTLTNDGSTSKSYTIAVDGADWADLTITPTNVLVVGASESKSAFINLEATKDATAGEQTFAVSISSGDKVLKQVPLKANVIKASLGGLKKALEIGLVILVVLLVILGLIIGFNKLKSGNDEEDKEDQTYY